MRFESTRSVSGHVYRYDGKRGSVWRVKYRLPDGRQVHRALGHAWSGRGRPPSGYFTRRTAEAALREILTDARRGNVGVGVGVHSESGITFMHAAEEWFRHGEDARGWKPSTIRDYRSAL